MQQPRVAVRPSDRFQRSGRLWLRRGGILLGVGTGPLLLIVLLSKIGIGDPNPNPVGPGMLAALTFWPSVGMIVFGSVQLLRARLS